MESLPQNPEFWNNQNKLSSVGLCLAMQHLPLLCYQKILCVHLKTFVIPVFGIDCFVPWQFTVILIKTEYNETTGFVFDQYLTMTDPQQ